MIAEMNSLEVHHFKINRFLLLAIGLWPFQKSKFTQVQFIVFFSILITFIIFQFTTFITSDCTADHIIKVVSNTFFCGSLAIKYNSFWINANTIKLLLDQLQCSYNKLKNKNEIAIIAKYSSKAQLQTTTFTIFGACGLLIIIILPVWPNIISVLLPLNISRPHPQIYVATEYFIDQENCLYLILLHSNVAVCIGVTAMLATGTTLLAYFKYICGMFNIASYRIEKAMMINMQQKVNEEKMIIIYKGIIYGIDIHRKAIEFSQFFIRDLQGSFFFLILTGVISLSTSLVCIVSVDNIEEVFPFIIILLTLYTYLLMSNYVSQEVTDHNNHVFTTVYNVQWYVAPLRIQKMLLFLLQRGTKTFNLNLGGLFVGSLESAATLASASISYFTVLYSTRNGLH